MRSAEDHCAIHARSRRVFSVGRITHETFVQHVEYHRSIPSTNTRALELAASSDSRVPALVLAEHQTAGRGRGANAWWTAPGSIAFSLVLDLNAGETRTESWPAFALAAAVGVCDSLESVAAGTQFGIRWPNDVCLDQKKICGILPELHLGAVPRLVLGVGINVNNTFESAPQELHATATSLATITGHRANLTTVLVHILQSLDRRFEQLTSSDPQLPRAWSDRCLLRSRIVRLRMDSEEVEGRCMGIDASGALRLEVAGGAERFYGGTVAFVGDSAE
jgi:BirA family biotin operon repressor/biotin-[acetyl-CoA-carboxylase] ligase